MKHLAAAAVCVLLFAGCGSEQASDPNVSPPATTSPSPTPGPDELSKVSGPPCPPVRSFPQVTQTQTQQDFPVLSEITKAWLCSYDVESLRVGVKKVDPDEAVRAVEGTKPAPLEQACTEEFGPGYMLVFATDSGDLTAIVVNDHGCRPAFVLTDPFDDTSAVQTQFSASSDTFAFIASQT